VSFILPGFHMVDRIMDKTERDNTDTVLVVPECPHTLWWRRLASGAWRARVATSEFLPANILIPHKEHCFLGATFTSRLLVLRANAQRIDASANCD
jgi:uncharacterized protein YeaO (DUF488 family)